MVIFHSYVAVYQRVTCLPTVKLWNYPLRLPAISVFLINGCRGVICITSSPTCGQLRGLVDTFLKNTWATQRKKRSFGGITETVSFGLVNVCWCWGLRGVHIHHIPGKFHSIKRSQPLVAPAPPALFRHDAYLRAHSNRWHIDDMLSHISLLLYI